MNVEQFKTMLLDEKALNESGVFRTHHFKKTIQKYASLIECLTPNASHMSISTRLRLIMQHNGEIPKCKICNNDISNERWIKWKCPTCSKNCANELRVRGWKLTHSQIDPDTGKTLAQKYAQEKADNRKNTFNPITGLSRQQEISSKMKETKRNTFDDKGRDIYKQGAIKTAIARFGKYLGKEGKSDFEWYKHLVADITSKQPLQLLDNIEKRAAYGKSEDPYQLDHKFSVVDGYIENIPPYIIGNIVNLEMLPARQNTSKGSKSSITKEELFETYFTTLQER